jgi:UDP-2,3-diacylglucosamine pyrophosphatase LpxH
VEKKLARSNFKHKTNLPLELMKAYGDKRSRDGFTDVVFGHFHQKMILPASNSTVTVLPAWYESGEALRIDPKTGAADFVVI